MATRFVSEFATFTVTGLPEACWTARLTPGKASLNVLDDEESRMLPAPPLPMANSASWPRAVSCKVRPTPDMSTTRFPAAPAAWLVSASR